MIDFGFGVSPSSRINLEKADKEKFNELAIAEPDVAKCMACGSCSASCTAAAFEDTSLRRAILSLQNGLCDDASKLLSHCMLCGKCTMVCPRGINTRHLILSIQKIYSL